MKAQEDGLLAFLFSGRDGEFQGVELKRAQIFVKQLGHAIIRREGSAIWGALLFYTMSAVDLQSMVLVASDEEAAGGGENQPDVQLPPAHVSASNPYESAEDSPRQMPSPSRPESTPVLDDKVPQDSSAGNS